jgi:hypothetical protein
MTDPEILAKLEEAFQKLQSASDEECHSLLKKHLTREVFDNLKTQKTNLGATLLDVIQSGVENLDSGIGVYAPDADSYAIFADLFDPIIDEYHKGFSKSGNLPVFFVKLYKSTISFSNQLCVQRINVCSSPSTTRLWGWIRSRQCKK